MAIVNSGSGVVDAYGCYWGTGSGLTPPGPGALVSGSVNYGSSFPAFDGTKIDLGMYNPTCGVFSVRLRPYMRSQIHTSPTNECVLNNLVFTVRWPSTAGFTALQNVNTYLPGLMLMGSVTLSGSYYYATYATVGAGSLSWNANTEYEIMTFDIPGTGTGVIDLSVVNDSWTAANNGDFYIDMISNGAATDLAAGVIYESQPDASANCGVYAKAILGGAYVGSGPLYMSANLSSATNQIPSSQPFNTFPWYYNGTESATITTDVTDWVLVELRSTTTSLFARRAALIKQDGNIYDVDGTSPVVFHSIIPGTGYYIAIHHRNHAPVMSAASVSLPNTAGTIYDFTALANLYGSAPALNYSSLYTLVTGDINHDGKLKYSGSNNDRALIIAKLGTMFDPVYLNSVSPVGYWKEDLNMNKRIVYSGPSNDASAVILPALINLIPSANLITIWNCPVPGASKSLEACPHTGPVDAELTTSGEDLLVTVTSNQTLTGEFVDNIQFALKWNSNLSGIEELLQKTTSEYGLKPQGNPVLVNGAYYQVFAMVDWKALPDVWEAGTPLSVLHIPGAARFINGLNINEVDVIQENDYGYYFSVLGKDQTGQVKKTVNTLPGTNLSVFPNPSHNQAITLQLNTNAAETIRINLYNQIGQVVMVIEKEVSKGLNTLEISSDLLTSGAYLVKITGETTNASCKLLIE